jgi:hypothetical protein
MAGKIKCTSCDTRLEGRPAFCARCGEPTQWATAEDRRQHDLEKWRRHAAQVRGDVHASAPRIPASVAAVTDPRVQVVEEREDVHTVKRRSWPEPKMPRRAPEPKRERAPRPSIADRLKALFKRDDRPAPVIDLDSDSMSAPSACVTCQKNDWIIRTGRNEDDSFRYWCIRCSRAFKSDLRLAHARLPFIVAGSILAVLVILTNI